MNLRPQTAAKLDIAVNIGNCLLSGNVSKFVEWGAIGARDIAPTP